MPPHSSPIIIPKSDLLPSPFLESPQSYSDHNRHCMEVLLQPCHHRDVGGSPLIAVAESLRGARLPGSAHGWSTPTRLFSPSRAATLSSSHDPSSRHKKTASSPKPFSYIPNPPCKKVDINDLPTTRGPWTLVYQSPRRTVCRRLAPVSAPTLTNESPAIGRRLAMNRYLTVNTVKNVGVTYASASVFSSFFGSSSSPPTVIPSASASTGSG